MKRALVLAAVLGCAACSGGAPPGTSGSSGSSGGPHDFTMQFSLTAGVRSDANSARPFVGNVYGGIYRSQDVGALGPKDGGQSVADVEVDGVNLEDAGTGLSSEVWTSPELPPGEYVFFGYFDTNRDAGGPGQPGDGDVVTFPGSKVELPDAGGTRFLNAQFNLVCANGFCD